jgi:hypothetical protein
MTSVLCDAMSARARRVARRLAARGLPGLGEALDRLRGVTLEGTWRIESLYAVGAEGAVYTATRAGAGGSLPAVVKIPLLPYHDPADITSASLRHRRDALREEARYLERAASPVMPARWGLHEFENPLLDPDRGGPFAEPEPALVMERLPGLDVDLWLARVHRSGLPRESLRERLDALAVLLLESLRDLEVRGFLYADLRPGNLRVTGRPDRRLRLLDAGSLVEAGDTSGRYPHVPHYLPPDLFERRYSRDLPIVPTSAAQAVMAGRTLYELATGFVPVPGRPLVAADLRDCAVSPVLADAIDGLASGSFSSVIPSLRYIARQRTLHAAAARAAAAKHPANARAAAVAGSPVAPIPVHVPVAPAPAQSSVRRVAQAAAVRTASQARLLCRRILGRAASW